jgi:hypothetical protein
MARFNRGIENEEFISALIATKHWKEITDDKDLFIGIRDEYINIYYHGQSVFKVEMTKTQGLRWTSHRKYLGEEKSGYVNSESYLDRISDLKKMAYKHAGEEKSEVKKQILEKSDRCILDVEVTFGSEDGFGTRSIDYLAIEKDESGKLKLVFYEAKHFKNSEIRSRTEPHVFGQLSKYELVLKKHEKEIIASYNTVMKNMLELGIDNNSGYAQLLNGKKLDAVIDFEPRLIVFAIPVDKMQDVHMKKLKTRLGTDRLVLVQ